jgi:Activator of Hsp90 ATPase homolog 1-like protein
MGKEKETFAPVRQSVHVECPIEDAFRLFTEAFDEWWPLESCSVTGDEAESCAIEPWVGGKVFERTRSGGQRQWGSVTVWDPPGRLAFTWHPGARRDGSQTVTVEFQVEADGTRVTLTHRGWQWAGVATAASCFARFVSEQMLVAV